MKISEIKEQYLTKLSSIYPRQEIESFFYLLSESLLGLKRIDIALNPNMVIDDKKLQKFTLALTELINETPIQYIIGASEFYGLHFKVNKYVLIPRPETEELVDWVIEEVKRLKLKIKDHGKINILDIGTGSGCIGISLAKNLPDTEVLAVDISKNAIKIAKENAKLNQVSMNFEMANILDTNALKLKFNVIVSNPPYIRELEKKQMSNNVLQHEPHQALFVSNENPLIFYNRIADFAKMNLCKNGFLFFEINESFLEETMALLIKKDFKNIESKKDIFGKDRMVKANI